MVLENRGVSRVVRPAECIECKITKINARMHQTPEFTMKLHFKAASN